jgi:hypothetical protein
MLSSGGAVPKQRWGGRHDLLVINLLTMGVREIEEMRGEEEVHEPVSR